ncbi:FAD-dependent oxidoreductase [Bremerella sp. JC817]|uniref:FAD-dependent oxidoreductase n=1 Tax=Bremerella sp. JC817 TaxID=3231756 RepID=UPI0034590996
MIVVGAGHAGTEAALAAARRARDRAPWPQSRFESARMCLPPVGPPARALKYDSSYGWMLATATTWPTRPMAASRRQGRVSSASFDTQTMASGASGRRYRRP